MSFKVTGSESGDSGPRMKHSVHRTGTKSAKKKKKEFTRSAERQIFVMILYLSPLFAVGDEIPDKGRLEKTEDVQHSELYLSN